MINVINTDLQTSSNILALMKSRQWCQSSHITRTFFKKSFFPNFQRLNYVYFCKKMNALLIIIYDIDAWMWTDVKQILRTHLIVHVENKKMPIIFSLFVEITQMQGTSCSQAICSSGVILCWYSYITLGTRTIMSWCKLQNFFHWS